jgi:hypothetical protein
VKRELRTLTERDRDRFLDAAAIMWTVNTEEGKKLYGNSYTSMNTFVGEHALASNDIECDGYHDGSGFFTRHFAITNSFEASLRAINPAVTLHYWDFTIEGQSIKNANEIPSYLLKISPFFTDTWFGSVDEDNHIVNSRWAHKKMTVQKEVIPYLETSTNSFGFIRSVWNNNNDVEIARRMFDICGFEATSKAIPSCLAHAQLLNSSSLGDFQRNVAGVGHGPLHVHIGGVGGGCVDAMRNFIERWDVVLNENMTANDVSNLNLGTTKWKYGYTAPRMKVFKEKITGHYYHFYRALWRSHICSRDNSIELLKCPTSCNRTLTIEECKCSIPNLSDNFSDIENVFYCIIEEPSRDMFRKLFSDDFITDLVLTISSSSVYEGEMIESASPIDIAFWVIHPTLERLLAAKRLTTISTIASNPFVKWPSIDGSGEDWLEYSDYSYGVNVSKTNPLGYTCLGHAMDDIVLPDRLPMIEGFVNNADKNGDGLISNWEYFLGTNPNDALGLDYVYDSFEWPHC